MAALGLPVTVALFACPPYLVIDTGDPQVRHAALGRHPLWRPPTPELADEGLRRAGKAPRGGSSPSLQVRVNRVRLAAELAGAAAVTASLVGALACRRPTVRPRGA